MDENFTQTHQKLSDKRMNPINDLLTKELILSFGSIPAKGLFKRSFIYGSLELEDLIDRSLLYTLVFTKMFKSSLKDFDRLPSIRDQKVNDWISSNGYFKELLNRLNRNILNSIKNQGFDIKDIYITDAHPSDNGNELEEFVLNITVPKGTDLVEINELWDFFGSQVTELLDESYLRNNIDLVSEFDEKLLIVVNEEE